LTGILLPCNSGYWIKRIEGIEATEISAKPNEPESRKKIEDRKERPLPR